MSIYFTEDHEYIRISGDTGTVGISDYAQGQLGDVVYVELPEVGAQFDQADETGVIESVKVASEIYSPVSGEIIEINEALGDSPSLVNDDPEVSGLKDEDEYADHISNLS